MNMERYFERNKEQLQEVFQKFRCTTYGRKLNLPSDFKNYYDFTKLPLLNSQETNFDEVYVPGEELWCFVTTGVSGLRKTVYRDVGTIVGYPKEMNEVLQHNDTLFLHSRRREREGYYETHDFNHKRMYPQGIFKEYNNKEELLKYVQVGDVLFIVEYPLMTEWICYQIESALTSRKIKHENLRKRKVYLELSGEPVTEKQIKNIVDRLKKIFQADIDYFVTYGSNEIGHIGTYVPILHGSDVMYEVVPSLFVEEINNELIITPFAKTGTILFRYKTGDKGTLFFKNDRLFIEVFGKNEDEQTLYIAGAQANMNKLVFELTNLLGSPIGLVVGKNEDKYKGRYGLNITLHTFDSLNDSTKHKLFLFVKQFIMNSALLEVESRLGIFDLNIAYSTKPLKKQVFFCNGKER